MTMIGAVARRFFRVSIISSIAAATIFLPMVVLGLELTNMVRGLWFAPNGIGFAIGETMLVYLGVSLSVAVGVVPYSVALSLSERFQAAPYVQLVTLASAPLVPATPVALDVMGSFVLSEYQGATVAATIAYAAAMAIWGERWFAFAKRIEDKLTGP